MKNNSFTLYAYQAAAVSDFSAEQKGMLLTALFEYAAGTIPEIPDTAVKVAFKFISARMDKDAGIRRKRQAAVNSRWEKSHREPENTNADSFIQNDTNAYKTIQTHTKNTKEEKEEKEEDSPYNPLKEEKDKEKEESPSTTKTRVCEEMMLDEMKFYSPIWRETMRMKYLISDDELLSWLDKFTLHCRSRDVKHDSLRDCKAHFDDWLRISLRDRRKTDARRANNNISSDKADFNHKIF